MKRLVLASLVLSSLALAAAGSGAARPAADDPCFLTRDLRGHTVGDDHTLYFDVNGRWTYRVTTSDNCLVHATGSDPILLRDRGLGKICRPLDLQLTVRGTRCLISGLTRLTPAEASALPKRQQP
jgi:hypothetical protein